MPSAGHKQLREEGQELTLQEWTPALAMAATSDNFVLTAIASPFILVHFIAASYFINVNFVTCNRESDVGLGFIKF
jgi:hypothetical protein